MTNRSIAITLSALLCPSLAFAHGGEWVLYLLVPLWGAHLLMLLHILLSRGSRRVRRIWLGPYLISVALPFVPLLWAENGYPILLLGPFLVWSSFLVALFLSREVANEGSSSGASGS
jgi:hypothetical protein